MKLYKTVANYNLDSIKETGLLTHTELLRRGMQGNDCLDDPFIIPGMTFRFNYHFFRSDIPQLDEGISLLSYETDLSDVLVANMRLTNASCSLKRHYMDTVMPAQEFMRRSKGITDWDQLDPITGYKKSDLNKLKKKIEWNNLQYSNPWFLDLQLDSIYDEFFPEFLVPGPKLNWSELHLEENSDLISVGDKPFLNIRKTSSWP